MREHHQNLPQFFLSTPTACPYIAGREERKVFTHLMGGEAVMLNNSLTHGGFRRSQSIAYKPACEGCRACTSVRVLVDDFNPGRSLKRVTRANRDITARRMDPIPTSEQYSLFRDYIDVRHGDGGMAGMTVLDYAVMVEDTHVETYLIEYRIGPEHALDGQARDWPLAAVALIDVLGDGISMVYSFFDPVLAERGLGTYMILDNIERGRRFGLPYLYLGYWIASSPKMAYKTRFRPQEHLMPHGWVRI